ncbi:hypothetical protein HS088_TW14G00662 [Tripterygium wilfordii]|uniref:Uncharacterized protein n=1 Tax=Tripterygium wilfordii TaxID=458696 RepID=A0A7J7CR87_TRIWF|nr:hypothetical protein HS088_TW14G00662 [Tripterygium wilfordii]
MGRSSGISSIAAVGVFFRTGTMIKTTESELLHLLLAPVPNAKSSANIFSSRRIVIGMRFGGDESGGG